MVFGDHTLSVGAAVDPELFQPMIRIERLRQFYEQRRLEPFGQDLPAPIRPVASQIIATHEEADLPAVEIPVEESALLDPPPPPQRRGRGRPRKYPRT